MKHYNRLMTLLEAAQERDETPVNWRMHPKDSDEIMYSCRAGSPYIDRINAGMRLMGLDVVETTQCEVGEIQLVTQ